MSAEGIEPPYLLSACVQHVGLTNIPPNAQIKALIKILNVLLFSEIYLKDEALIHLKVF